MMDEEWKSIISERSELIIDWNDESTLHQFGSEAIQIDGTRSIAKRLDLFWSFFKRTIKNIESNLKSLKNFSKVFQLAGEAGLILEGFGAI